MVGQIQIFPISKFINEIGLSVSILPAILRPLTLVLTVMGAPIFLDI